MLQQLQLNIKSSDIFKVQLELPKSATLEQEEQIDLYLKFNG